MAAAGATDRGSELLHRGWAVRRGDTFPELSTDHLRVAVRAPGTSAAFAASLADVGILHRQLHLSASDPTSE